MDLNYVVCSYCGQTIFGIGKENITDRELAGKLACTCDKAKEFQRRHEESQQLIEKVEILFGDQCETKNPVYKPLPPEVFAEVKRLAEAVAFERIESAVVMLPDDTKAKITYTTIERSKTIKTKLS